MSYQRYHTEVVITDNVDEILLAYTGNKLGKIAKEFIRDNVMGGLDPNERFDFSFVIH